MNYSIKVVHTFPRHPPHDHGRGGRPFVPDDVKKWRASIVRALEKAGVPKNLKEYRVFVDYQYVTANKKTADTDSLTHAAQDAISKDYGKTDDKDWGGSYRKYLDPCRKDTFYAAIQVRHRD